MPARSLAARSTTRRTGLFARLSDLLALHASRARLAGMDDHMLRDIGVTREQADHELEKSLWDAPAGWRR